MEINALTLVLSTVIVTLAIAGAISVFFKTKKANPDEEFQDTFARAWVKIRPILSELFINLFNLYQADKEGFEGLVKFAVEYVYNKIQEADFLLPEEKELFTKDFLRSLLEPKLKELYEKRYGN